MAAIAVDEYQESLFRSATTLRLTWELYARGIIEKRTLDAVIGSEDGRAKQLVTDLEKKLGDDPQCVSEVVEVLEKSGDYGSVAESIKNKWGQSSHQTDRPQGPTVRSKMLALRTSFTDVSTNLNKIDNADANKLRTIVCGHLQNLLPNAQAYHMKQMEQKHSVEDILSTLISSGFCSYLDYKPLPAAVSLFGIEELKQLLETYEEEHEAFCKETTLMELVQTLTDNPELQPVVSVGTPSLVFQLSHPWRDLRLYTAIKTLCSVLPWVSKLQLQAVEGGDHIALVFCGFKSALTSLVGDLQKPDTARILQELGISVVLRMASHPLVQQPAAVMTTACAVQTTDDVQLVLVSQQEEEEEEEEDEEEEEEEDEILLNDTEEPLLEQRNTEVTRTGVRMVTLEERLAKYEREVEMLLQKRVAQLTAEESHSKEEEDQLAPLKEIISEKMEEIHKMVTSNEKELAECRRELATAREAKDQLMAQLGAGLASLSNQLKEMNETHQAALKAREERSNEEIASFKQKVSSLQQDLEESRKKLTTVQEAKDQLATQLSRDVASLNHQLKAMRERHEAVLKDREEEIKLLQEQLEKSRRVEAVTKEVHEATREEKASTTPQRSPVQAVQAIPFTYSTAVPVVGNGHDRLLAGATEYVIGFTGTRTAVYQPCLLYKCQ